MPSRSVSESQPSNQWWAGIPYGLKGAPLLENLIGISSTEVQWGGNVGARPDQNPATRLVPLWPASPSSSRHYYCSSLCNGKRKLKIKLNRYRCTGKQLEDQHYLIASCCTSWTWGIASGGFWISSWTIASSGKISFCCWCCGIGGRSRRSLLMMTPSNPRLQQSCRTDDSLLTDNRQWMILSWRLRFCGESPESRIRSTRSWPPSASTKVIGSSRIICNTQVKYTDPKHNTLRKKNYK